METQILAQDGQQDLRIVREFDLPIELLYRAYTEPEIIEQWMNTKVIKHESKKHGSYQFETSHNGQVMFKANGTIHELIPNQQMIRTFEMENAPIGVQLEFITFEKLENDRSKIQIHIVYKSVEHRAAQLSMPFAYGLNMAHQKLQEIVQQLK